MSKRVIRSFSEVQLQAQIKSRKKNSIPIGLDRFNTVRSTRLDLFRPRSVAKTKNLIKYLLGSGSRAQRSVLPKQYAKLRVIAPNGKKAVRLSFH